MSDGQAKARLTHADIAALAAKLGMQCKLRQPMVGWEIIKTARAVVCSPAPVQGLKLSGSVGKAGACANRS